MTRKIVTGTYTFCMNSNYYEAFVNYVKDMSGDAGKKDSCDKLSTSMTFSNNLHGKDICQNFKFLFKSLSEQSARETTVNGTLSDNDCNFLNYWLNCKLRDNVKYGAINVKDFYEKMKDKDVGFFSKQCNLYKHFYNIDNEILENMKLLYKLYDDAVKIMSIISNEYYINEEEKQKEQDSCSEHTKECDENYKKAMDRCLNSNVDFYNALKNFKDSYDIITEPNSNESNACKYSKFSFFPAYDPILEKQRYTIKISSTLFSLSMALSLIYKFTPLGPFLRTKINMVKDRWMNVDKNESELLSISTDTEDHISENGEYNIGYYSETN
ncbi:PIR Superfamily Protein [Plasmodium ovale wallikeri]|uniref:PIR Superfamily Protein n=1 Tax=Plasmodium ovale wallikeri TaxID=864142 RepID=A0A1A9AH92_PLAOA|nr:PIR Superfamily Protein [Plasmodium ovale wallikeri]SBT57553.1 PIR Superfamily Protein [Plasmodium ovale wallikeri]